jgi:hypothetical protein
MAAEVKTLQDFEEIKENIRTAPARVIRALHNVIYEEEGDRSNRKRLRQFTGLTSKLAPTNLTTS